MFMLQKMHALQVGAAPAASGFPVNAVDFDGTNDYLTRGAGLTGAADSSQGILSCWFRRDATGQQNIMRNTTGRVNLFFSSTNKLTFFLANAAETNTLTFVSSASYTDASWHSLQMAWDTNFSAGNKLLHIYVDDAAVTAGTLDDLTAAFNIDYTDADWAIGATTTGTLKLNGCLSEFYFNLGNYLDLSSSTNRRKFSSAGNKPISLGTTGDLPTGANPTVFLNNAAASFGTNKGTGGNLTINGTLDTASSSPSD